MQTILDLRLSFFSKFVGVLWFCKYRKRDYDAGDVPDIDLLDNRLDYSLYVEVKCQNE